MNFTHLSHLWPVHLWPGVPIALASAILFGAAAPASKLLMSTVDPQLIAGLLYLGAGLGLSIVHFLRNAIGLPVSEAPLRRSDLPWLSIIILFGGILGPLFLMLGLNLSNAASGSLLLNLEGLATMAIAWLVFRESVDRKLLLGAFAILAGAFVLAFEGRGISVDAGVGLIALACLAWGIDNNLTRKLSASDPVQLALVKGLAAGIVNITISLMRGAALPDITIIVAAGFVGFFGVGVSLVLFVLALRHLGAARTGAYFSLAPFIGALIAIGLLHQLVTWQILIAGSLMGIGLWLHLAERHQHTHDHYVLEHEHNHVHNEHHQHIHDGVVTEPHSHWHRHEPMRHSHAHYPDLHHRHEHDQAGSAVISK